LSKELEGLQTEEGKESEIEKVVSALEKNRADLDYIRVVSVD
jgi:hypothetical protein